MADVANIHAEGLCEETLGIIGNGKWDGKESILAMRAASEQDGINYGWRQKEWIGFFFEYALRTGKSSRIQYNKRTTKGTNKGTVRIDFWDSENNCPIDAKTHVLNNSSANMMVLGNDLKAMREAIEEYGHIEYLIALGEADYDGDDASFATWQDSIKGKEIRHTSSKGIHRRMKTAFVPKQICIVDIDAEKLEKLSKDLFSQGHNSNQKPRSKKFKLQLTDDIVSSVINVSDGSSAATLAEPSKVSFRPIRDDDKAKSENANNGGVEKRHSKAQSNVIASAAGFVSTQYGKRYHNLGCPCLSRSKTIHQYSGGGLLPCAICCRT